MKNKHFIIITALAIVVAMITSFVSIHYVSKYRSAFFDGMEAGSNETAFAIVDQKQKVTALIDEFCGELNFALEMMPVPTENYMAETQYMETFEFIDSEERWN